jgi:tellurite resistance protein TerC
MIALAEPAVQAPELSLWYWAGFGLLVVILLFLDLAVFHRKAHRIKPVEAAWTTAFWVALALIFNGWIWVQFGSDRGLKFLTGYLIEEALSIDNIFVFVVIFRHFAVKPEYQHRILFWGILGAIFMRLGFILAGTALIKHFHAIVYLFGAILIYTGVRLMFHRETEIDPERSWVLRLFRRWVPTTTEYEGARFLIRRDGRTYATPLLLVLVVVETTDVMFAVDSVPAILAITTDRFIVFTSNIFAILGLRSIYFLLAGMMEAFRFLKVGLSLILLFVGAKMIAVGWLIEEIPVVASLGVIATIMAGSVVASLAFPRRTR